MDHLKATAILDGFSRGSGSGRYRYRRRSTQSRRVDPSLARQRSADGVVRRNFSPHAVLTAMHIIPAGIFVLLSAAVLLRRTGGEWLEWLFFPFGAMTGATAYAMSSYAVGGWVERSAVLVFNTWFVLSLGRAYWSCLHGVPSRKREWMTRAVGILLGIATTRPVVEYSSRRVPALILDLAVLNGHQL